MTKQERVAQDMAQWNRERWVIEKKPGMRMRKLLKVHTSPNGDYPVMRWETVTS